MAELDSFPAPSPAPVGPGRWRRRWRRVPRAARLGAIWGIWAGLGLAVILLWGLRDLPRPEVALDRVRRPSLIVEDGRGARIASYGDVVGTPRTLADLPAYVPDAVVAVEDRRFWQHGAIDPWGIARAAAIDLLHGRVVQGGSSLTQQVAKTLFLSDARTWRRKLQELVLTYWLARRFTRAQILEIWLNRVYFGQGASGIDAAARLYFGVPAPRLALWQAAMLAGLPRAPARFNPRTDPAAAVARTRQVLAAMVAAGKLTPAGRDAALGSIDLGGKVRAEKGGWYADWIADQAETLLPPDEDAVLRTTLDPGLQARAEAALTQMLAADGAKDRVSEGAVVALDAESGAVQALVGGRDYAPGGFDRAVAARRQAGSAFKPFVWLAALQAGMRPEDRVLDGPIRLGRWRPADFTRHYLGPVSLSEGLALSLNSVSVRLLLRAGGPRAVARVARRLGVEGAFPDDATLALGSGTVRLLPMAAAYASFCNGGHGVVPYGIADIMRQGRTEAKIRTPGPAVMTGKQAAMMEAMLAAVVQTGTGRRAAVPGHRVIGKTGTTQDYRDAWFIGCIDGRRVIGVWLGNDDGTPMRGVEGGSLPAALFRTLAGGSGN